MLHDLLCVKRKHRDANAEPSHNTADYLLGNRMYPMEGVKSRYGMPKSIETN